MSQQQPDGPKHKYYTNVADGEVYPALKSPPGYQDQNPSDWRPSSEAEVKVYLAKAQHINDNQKFNDDGSTKLGGAGRNDAAADPVAAELPPIDVDLGNLHSPPPPPVSIELASETQPGPIPPAPTGALPGAIPPPPATGG